MTRAELADLLEEVVLDPQQIDSARIIRAISRLPIVVTPDDMMTTSDMLGLLSKFIPERQHVTVDKS